MSVTSTKKRVIAALSTIAITGSIGIGGMLLNTPPQDKLDLLPVTPIENTVVTPVPKTTATPIVKPSTSPKASIVPVKTTMPTKQPKIYSDVVEIVTPDKLEVIETPTAKVDTFSKFGISTKESITAKYVVKKLDSNRSEFSLDIPNILSADMFELYLNQQYIDKQLLPSGTIIAPPLIFTDTNVLEVHIIKMEVVIGIGKFENGLLTIYLKEGIIHD